MFEIDFLPVGDTKSGDAIALRFTHPLSGEWVQVIVDAGFKDDGEALVDHVSRYYDSSVIDLAILTHPDGDHIGGMGEVLRGFEVRKLWLQDIGSHGGSSLPAARAIKELLTVAGEQGTDVYEVFAGDQEFDGALTIIGPDRGFYDELVTEQVSGVSPTTSVAKAALAATRGVWDRIGNVLGEEIPFPEKEVNPRNNSSTVTLLNLDGKRVLLTADAGVPALSRAWDYADSEGLADDLSFVQIPHHGSRRNGSSAWLDRLLGPTGQEPNRSAFLSVAPNSEKHPSGRIVNAYERRGCYVIATAGVPQCFQEETPMRPGWSNAIPLGPMIEEDETED